MTASPILVPFHNTTGNREDDMTIDTVRYGQAADTTRNAVATFLTPTERQRVDAAGQGCYVALHRESFEDLLVDLRTRAVSAVLVSVARYQTQHATQVARLVREFPRVPAVALLTISETRTTHSLLALGQQGVSSLSNLSSMFRATAG